MTHPQKPRRLPAPKIPPGLRPLPPRPSEPPAQNHPHVARIVHLIEQMAATSGLQAPIIVKDWVGMLESGLKQWPANLRSMALEGQFIEDPPDIQAIFRQARERYLRVSADRPAVYRQMQEAFSEAFALLLESAAAGLEGLSTNPDVIGRVVVTCLNPGHRSDWLRYFPDWITAQTTAQATLPEAHERVYLVLAEAAWRARAAGHTIALNPGHNYEIWFEQIRPYIEPLVIGPPLVSSSVELLAAASQFPDWALKTGLVTFTFDPALEPLIGSLININVMLFGLNHYLLAHCEALADIQAGLSAQLETDLASPSSGYPPPAPADPALPPAPAPRRRPATDQSFAELFRRTSRR